MSNWKIHVQYFCRLDEFDDLTLYTIKQPAGLSLKRRKRDNNGNYRSSMILFPAIDRLEGFHPGGSCLSRRVLVPVRTKGAELPDWFYIVDVTEHLSFKPLPSGKWRS